MRAGRRHNRSSVLLDFYACFLIPAYTLLFAGSVTWLGTNFSVLAVTGKGHYRGFVLWGLLAGVYFLVMLMKLTATLSGVWRRGGLYFLILTACGSLGYAILIPYLPDQFPRYARLHVMLAFSACVLVMAALLVVILSCRREDKAGYGPLLWAWLAIAVGCGLLFALAGMVSSALEVFFTISATLLVRSLWLRRNPPANLS